MMKIITYNVNGLRAAVSKGLPEWLAQENPDILCLQETKLQPDQYPGEVFVVFDPMTDGSGILGAARTFDEAQNIFDYFC